MPRIIGDHVYQWAVCRFDIVNIGCILKIIRKIKHYILRSNLVTKDNLYQCKQVLTLLEGLFLAGINTLQQMLRSIEYRFTFHFQRNRRFDNQNITIRTTTTVLLLLEEQKFEFDLSFEFKNREKGTRAVPICTRLRLDPIEI